MAKSEHSQTERWQRREQKLRKRHDGMQESGAGLKKVILPILKKKAEKPENDAPGSAGRGREGE